jgi:hypothetical protein
MLPFPFIPELPKTNTSDNILELAVVSITTFPWAKEIEQKNKEKNKILRRQNILY